MKVIITGATGMVGKGILLECLADTNITEVLLISRSPIDLENPKIKELLIPNFMDIPQHADQLKGYDACFHAMGVSSAGMSEEKYTALTYDISMNLAKTLYALNPGMTFNYISGAGTDSSEQGRSMWARVKGKTENDIRALGFKHAYSFRPGGIIPEGGVKSRTSWYQTFIVLFKPIFPLIKGWHLVSTTGQIGRAMIRSVGNDLGLEILESRDIKRIGA